MTKYDVFLSHNSRDKPAVGVLASRLMDEVGLRPFLDEWHLVPGETWQEAIEEALSSCTTCAVLVGPSGTGPWQNEEMRAAIERRVAEPAFRVIPVLLPGAADPRERPLPAFLRRYTWVDFRGGIDDEDAFQRLVSGIRGEAPGPAATSSQPVPLVTALSPDWQERFASRLEYFGLRLENGAAFGKNDLTKGLGQELRRRQPSEIRRIPATSAVMFLVVPHAKVQTDGLAVIKTTRDLFLPANWYDTNRPGPRYHASEIFPLGGHKTRTVHGGVVAEQEWDLPSGRFLVDVIRISDAGEAAYATSYHVFDEFVEGPRIFRLGAIISFFWSFLCLVWEVHDRVGYGGGSRACLAMINTKDCYLGHFAKGFPDPYHGGFGVGLLGDTQVQVCRDPNLLVCKDVDFSTFQPKVEPDILYQVAEEIALAFNLPGAWCFDPKTGRLLEYQLNR